MWYLDFIDVESSEGRTVTYLGQPYALRGGLSCADSNDPELSQRTSSARRRYDDSGPGAFRRFVRSVDVTCADWQIQPTYFGVRHRSAQEIAEFVAPRHVLVRRYGHSGCIVLGDSVHLAQWTHAHRNQWADRP